MDTPISTKVSLRADFIALDSAGNLYGTAVSGDTFEFTSSGSLTTLDSFGYRGLTVGPQGQVVQFARPVAAQRRRFRTAG